MRASAIIVLAVLIVALWAFDKYEYNGYYSKAIWGEINQKANKIH
jgi:hypothetical protein